MLVHVRTIAIDESGQRRKVFARMEARLAGKLDAGAVEEWNGVRKGRFETKLGRKGRFLLEPLRFLLRVSSQCRELVAGNPCPMTVDRFVLDDRIDLGSRRQTRIPDRLGMIASEIVAESCEVGIGHTSDVGGCVSRVDAAKPVAIDDGDALSSAFQKVSSRQSSDAGADDRNVDTE